MILKEAPWKIVQQEGNALKSQDVKIDVMELLPLPIYGIFSHFYLQTKMICQRKTHLISCKR